MDFKRNPVALLAKLEQHLDWNNRDPSPFISMYSDEFVARREGYRRVRAGKREVRIYKIDRYASDERMEYRSVQGLAKRLRFEIPEYALNNSMQEYVCLYRVPDSAVVDWEDLE